ncbi:MAG: class I SAM-dependent methyltransferase [Desulfobacteraceae bacterium]|nr:class I SAM-dependent methyltransferase [Desulfobacteraceae bacterium]
MAFIKRNDLETLKKENQWLKLELNMFKNEQNRTMSDYENIPFGTDQIQNTVPPLAPNYIRNTVSSPSLSGYYLVADGWYFLISQLLEKESSVLDIGCGCAKIARLFLYHPYIKKYVGFDNYEKSIYWCNQYITPFSPEKFQFIFADIISDAYNPEGKIKSSEFVFPLDDSKTDIAIAASLFTHLLEEDAVNYLKQTKRVLKREGMLIASIHTDTPSGEKYSGNEIRIDVNADYFVELAESCGLTFVNNPGKLLGQDIMIFKA